MRSLLLSVYDEIKSFGDRDRFYKRAADKELDDILQEAERPAEEAGFDRYYSAQELAPEAPRAEKPGSAPAASEWGVRDAVPAAPVPARD